LHGKRLERMPPQAEQDLDRQVRPPEIVVKSAGVVPAVPVRLRVLVGDDGRALDARLLTNSSSRFDDAWRQVKHWKFRPARWGSLAVPWYLDVEVPLEDWSHAQAASDSWGR
jgi:hypothetical protein